MAENLLWWLGWNPQFALKLGICLGVGSGVLFSSLAGLLLSLIVFVAWTQGVQGINRRWSKLLADAELGFKMAGAQKLGLQTNDGEWFVLSADIGSRRFLLAPTTEYRFDALYVTNSFVGIYAGNTYNMQSRTPKYSSTTRELHFRHIASFEYNAPVFRLVTTSGEQLHFSASKAPEIGDSVLNAVRQKLSLLRPAIA